MHNTITCGDCIELMQSMPNKSVHLTLTDIPYGVVNRESHGLRNLDKKNADIETFNLQSFLDGVLRITNGSIYVFCSTEQVSEIRARLVEAEMTTRLCIWKKCNPSPMNGQYVWLSGVECCVFGKFRGATFNEHCKNPVWEYPTPRNRHHVTEKPLALFEYLVKVSSNEGDVVFDPCLGGGTTAVAAYKHNRKYIGFEIDAECCRIAKERIEEMSK